MSMRDTTRWRQNGISCDHRPGSSRDGYGGRKFVDDKPRSAPGIPASILHYIATGEGAKPAADYLEPNGFYVETLPDDRKRCASDHCDNLMPKFGDGRWCATCIRTRNAEKYRASKMTVMDRKKEAVAC